MKAEECRVADLLTAPQSDRDKSAYSSTSVSFNRSSPRRSLDRPAPRRHYCIRLSYRARLLRGNGSGPPAKYGRVAQHTDHTRNNLPLRKLAGHLSPVTAHARESDRGDQSTKRSASRPRPRGNESSSTADRRRMPYSLPPDPIVIPTHTESGLHTFRYVYSTWNRTDRQVPVLCSVNRNSVYFRIAYFVRNIFVIFSRSYLFRYSSSSVNCSSTSDRSIADT